VTKSNAAERLDRRAIRPRVTVGLPVYNSADTIEQALEGLRKQTYSHFTLLISDNASTDGTSEILKTWAARDDRVVLHRQEANIGHTQNFRYVLDQADTEYFTWHASDDWVGPDYLEELVRAITQDPRCAFVAPRIVHVRADGSPVDEIPVPTVAVESRAARIRDSLRQSWGHRIYGLFRTEDLRRAKSLAEDFGYVWGWDAVAQLPFMLRDQMCGTNRATLFYRLNEGFSLKLYKPRSRLRLLRFWARYLWFHFRAWHASDLPAREKLSCLPALLHHSIDSLQLRPLRATIKLVRRPLRRILKTLGKGPLRALFHRK
jgi:glycosyltransferase involved in cell wall biosynthesis